MDTIVLEFHMVTIKINYVLVLNLKLLRGINLTWSPSQIYSTHGWLWSLPICVPSTLILLLTFIYLSIDLLIPQHILSVDPNDMWMAIFSPHVPLFLRLLNSPGSLNHRAPNVQRLFLLMPSSTKPPCLDAHITDTSCHIITMSFPCHYHITTMPSLHHYQVTIISSATSWFNHVEFIIVYHIII